MVPEIKQNEEYSGLPVAVEKNRRASLNYIKDRVWCKLQDERRNFCLKSEKKCC